MKTVFFVAFEFPPLNVGGTQRPLKFTKYLGDFHVHPVVFTLDPISYSNVFTRYFSDPNTVLDIPANCTIVNVPCDDVKVNNMSHLKSFISTYFSIVSREADGWHRHIVRAFKRQMKLKAPHALIVTSPPFSMVQLGVKLSKQFNIPLILDMRDSWSGWKTGPYASIIHYWLTVFSERMCFKHANCVVVTSDQTLIDLLKLHPKLPKDKFHLIPNGYDLDITDWTIRTKDHYDEFTIGFVGSFYYSPYARDIMFTSRWNKRGHRILQYVPQQEDWLYQSPYFFFLSLIQLKKRFPETFNKVKVIFAGNIPDWLHNMRSGLGLDNHVDFFGTMPLSESLAFQNSCDALLVTSSKTINGNSYAIPGKTYEYISALKPIIGFVPRGALKRLLERTGLALICDPDSPDDSAIKLHELIAGNWQAQPNSSFLNQLHRKHLTNKLADLIHDVS